jgi:hypothetical protein
MNKVTALLNNVDESTSFKEEMYLGMATSIHELIKTEFIPTESIEIAPKGQSFYKDIFNNIYDRNLWGYGSGAGSLAEHNSILIKFITSTLPFISPTYLFDYGCGDWQYMKEVFLPYYTLYHGFDISNVILERTVKQYAINNSVDFTLLNENREDGFFGHFINRVQEIKSADGINLLLVKDVLQHLPNEDVSFFLKSIVPHFDYGFLVDGLDFTEGLHGRANDIAPGECRSLNLPDKNIDFSSTGNLNLIFAYWYHGDDNIPAWYKNVYFYSKEEITDHLFDVYKMQKIVQSIDDMSEYNEDVGLMLFHEYSNTGEL